MGMFQKNVKALIYCNAIISIVSMFSGSFLVAYFYNATTNYIFTVGVYGLFFYSFIGIGFYFLGRILVNGKYRDIVYKIGIILKCLYVLLIVLLRENVVENIIILGILCGFGDGFYWSSFHVIKNDLVNSRSTYNKYTYFATLIGKTINITMPIILGTLIDFSSFINISIYILILCLCAFVLSFFIKSQKLKEQSYSLKCYIKTLHENKETYKPLKYVYLGVFTAGLRTIISSLTTIIIMMTFGTNMGLGIISSIMTVCTVFLLFFYNRFEKFKKSKILFIFVLVAPLFFSIFLVFTMSKLGLILFDLTYNLACTTLDYSLDVNRYSVLKQLNLKEFIVEHHVYSEILIASARTFTYFAFCLIGLSSSLVAFKILLICLTAAVPTMAICMRKLQMNAQIENGETIEIVKIEETKILVANNENDVQNQVEINSASICVINTSQEK